MKLLICRDGSTLELEDNIVMKANDFGVWFWENFFTIDAKKVINPDLSKYDEIYEDFKDVWANKKRTQLNFEGMK